ncbi:hypothetical protein DACRYDRAFT_112185 [Dacryopinax primogenitus]|uniref:cAMP-independent regulatory protein pac2 n=1 Tax=Dacryopinax primogenitus (strain DJM 731) TaxID=1858805 RepID=M5FVA0_DACPD|nr:uncharacterized protein DACRYDRAFT_112185 [Dacryopinax primogenitus]EJT97241.1 hypothetical protein DACRYDRAFT_112185 [Dacryopinax primogenitus]
MSAIEIRNAHEAHIVMEAVRLGQLPLISRRLSTKERLELIRHGAVFVWEESDYRGGVDRGGIERWTDGCKWSQSRMHEPFLLYEEKAEVPKEESEKLSGDKKGDAASRARRQNRPNKPDGLTKQTYSALLSPDAVPPGQKPAKWHLTCYFQRPNHTQLPLVEEDGPLSKIQPQAGTFVTAKGLTRRKSAAVSLDPADDALARLHTGSINGTQMGGGVSLRGLNGSIAETESDVSISPSVSTSPQSPYDMRYTAHSPWSGTSSLTGNSPLTPPAQYGVPHSPHAVAPHYSPVVMPQYQYPPHAAAYTHPASQPQLGPTSASPNSNFHMFQSSSRENLSLPPIRSTHNVQRARLPSVPVHPWCTADATGLGVQMPPPMTNGVTYGGTQGIPTGNSAIYDASRGCYVDTLAGRSQYHDDHRAWGPGVAIKNE